MYLVLQDECVNPFGTSVKLVGIYDDSEKAQEVYDNLANPTGDKDDIRIVNVEPNTTYATYNEDWKLTGGILLAEYNE